MISNVGRNVIISSVANMFTKINLVMKKKCDGVLEHMYVILLVYHFAP